MSRPRHQPEPVAPPRAMLLSDSIAVGNMKLSGIAKTTNGYAVAVAEVTPEGKVISLKLGRSQAFPQFIAIEHKRVTAKLSQDAQLARPKKVG